MKTKEAYNIVKRFDFDLYTRIVEHCSIPVLRGNDINVSAQVEAGVMHVVANLLLEQRLSR